jgi:hypothetical protein
MRAMIETCPGRSKRHRLRSENGPLMPQKRGIYGSIQCIYGPFSVRIIPYNIRL